MGAAAAKPYAKLANSPGRYYMDCYKFDSSWICQSNCPLSSPHFGRLRAAGKLVLGGMKEIESRSRSETRTRNGGVSRRSIRQSSECIRGTFCTTSGHLQYVCVNHRCTDITVTQQLLNRSDVRARLQHMSGKRMAPIPTSE